MYPAHIAFSGYALIGLTLSIMAASIAVYLVRLPSRSGSTRYLVAFFAAVSLSGLSSILSNAIFYWDRLFLPWQDFWVLAAGVALSQFAYAFPRQERSPEARAVLYIMSALALTALAYAVYFDIRFLTQPPPTPQVNDWFYLLLPSGTLLVVLVFLRRSLHYSQLARRSQPQAPPAGWRDLFSPQGRDAASLRDLALALSLAFLPGVQTLVHFPPPYGFVLTNIGSLLAITAIALVYFNSSSEITSFMAKLVGITLGTVLLIFSVVGSLDIYRTEQNLGLDRGAALRAAYDELVATGGLITTPPAVAYLVRWDASRPDDPTGYQLSFQRAASGEGAAGFSLPRLIEENTQGRLSEWADSLPDELSQQPNPPWRAVQRRQVFPEGSLADYAGFAFVAGGSAYEVGFSQLELYQSLSNVVVSWMTLVVVSTLLILVLFPTLFRTTLVEPLQALLAGIRRVNSGDLETAVPVQFNDEIGYLTRSFNSLTRTLNQSQTRQKELVAELQQSYAALEIRIAERTRELSAFADLTMVMGSDEPLGEALQPALTRILETGLCQAAAVHLFEDGGACLQMVAQRDLPAERLDVLQSVALSGALAARVHNSYDFWNNPPPEELPSALQIPDLPSYMGAPLSVGGDSSGWMSFYREVGESFQTGEASLLAALARQVAVIVENHNLRERITEVATVEERQRLARDLHDSATQLLYSLALFSRSSMDALDEGDSDRLRANLTEMQSTSLQALREIRSLLFELQPDRLNEVGLMEALARRFDMVERRVGIKVEFQPLSTPELPPRVERELYFVAIEALNNALKHADARSVSLIFTQTGTQLEMALADDGRGFELARIVAGLGLENMRQRLQRLGGRLEVESALSLGTRIVAVVPVTW